MQKRYKEVEEAFAQLKRKFRLGKISRQEFIERLERLRLKDEEGRFWMIGVRSSKWYYFDGKEWVQSEPPSIKDKKAICIYCGFENRLEAESCAHCKRIIVKKKKFFRSGRRLDEYSRESLLRSRKEKGWERRREEALEDERMAKFVFRSLSPLSFLVFLGTIGLLLGTIIGAFTGATNYFSGIVKILPSFIQENKGNLLGGIIYAVLGGVLGFIVFGLFGFCNALFINAVSSFVGGVKIDIEKIRER